MVGWGDDGQTVATLSIKEVMSATQSPAFSRLNQEMAGKKPKATTQLKTDEYAPTAPRDAVQNVMVYHFYR